MLKFRLNKIEEQRDFRSWLDGVVGEQEEQEHQATSKSSSSRNFPARPTSFRIKARGLSWKEKDRYLKSKKLEVRKKGKWGWRTPPPPPATRREDLCFVLSSQLAGCTQEKGSEKVSRGQYQWLWDESQIFASSLYLKSTGLSQGDVDYLNRKVRTWIS